MLKTNGITFSLGFRIVLSITGMIIIIIRPQDFIINIALDKEIPLVNGSATYELWNNIDLELKICLFHVANPIEVQKNGDVAILVEYGPYVYDDHLERIVLGVNDSADTIEYVAKRTIKFNATKSGNYSEDDEITIMNAAYIGTMLTIADQFAPFLPMFGNKIPLLFPDTTSIFIRAKVKDILFDGVPLICDQEANPDLGMICTVLKSRRPATIRSVSDNGNYAFSFFDKSNGTYEGPSTISRGLKDRYTVGYLEKFKGSHYAEYWSVKNCSVVRGSDSIFYAPMKHRVTELLTYASDMCRSVPIEYAKDEVRHGLLGYHYKTTKNLWNGSDSACYCPRAQDGTMECLSPGAIDMQKCQEAPVIMSEPHFLHGASSLSSIIQGLHPDENKHSAYVVLEPLTGAPLSGSRRIQINTMLRPLPVDLLGNVSHGIFPILWIDEGLTPEAKLLATVIFVHRVKRVLDFLAWIPFIIGLILLMYSYWVKAAEMYNIQYQKTSGSRIIILAPKNSPNNSQ